MSNQPAFIDRTGKKYGRWTVLSRVESKNGKTLWKCICDCGTVGAVGSSGLGSGHSKSCGCLKVDWAKEHCKTHGKSHSRVHNIWFDMKKRCFNKNCVGYRWYGARGIVVCDKWMKFENFYADMGDPPEGTSIDRINTNGNYEPGNCRWATDKEQANNTCKNKFIEYAGKRQTVAQWAEEIGIGAGTIWWRIRNGFPPSIALSKDKIVIRRGGPRKTNRILTLGGVSKNMSQWSRETGIRVGTIWYRLKMGWSVERTLTNA